MKIFKLFKQRIQKIIENLYLSLSNRPVHKALVNIGVGYYGNISTYTKPEELRMLYWLAHAIPEKGNVLEIGSYLGASTCYLAAAVIPKSGHLYCVDTWNNETMPDGERDTFQEFQNNIAPCKENIIAIRKNSQDINSSDISDGIDLIFIDGDHEYLSVKRDFEISTKFINPEAVIAFHDCLAFLGVSKVIGEALATGKWAIGGQVNNLFWIRKVNATANIF